MYGCYLRSSMRLWIAAFFLLLFACQALPVAALGKHWVKTQISDNGDAGDEDSNNPIPEDSKVKKSSSSVDEAFLWIDGQASKACSAQAHRLITLHRPDHLPVLYTGEVSSPPPDGY